MIRRKRGPGEARRKKVGSLIVKVAFFLLLASCALLTFKAHAGVRSLGGPVVQRPGLGHHAGEGEGEGVPRILGSPRESRSQVLTPRDDGAEKPEGYKAKTDVFQPCLPAKVAEERGVYLIRSARPKGMSNKEFQSGVERCWRRRRRSEPLFPAERLPSLDDDKVQVKLNEDEMRDLVFVHRENLKRLGQSIKNDSGKTLLELLEAGNGGGEPLPANASQALSSQRRGDCAVVASGGSLQGTRMGKTIDAHEVVVRINQAPTVPRTSVGGKTTIRLINNLWSKTYAKADLSHRRQGGTTTTPAERNLTFYVTRTNADDYLRLVRGVSARARGDINVRLVSSRVVSMVRSRLLSPYRDLLEASGEDELTAALLEGRDTPSSGLVAVFLMIQLCESVTAYGFSGINDGRAYHYWKSNRQYQNRTHSFSAERALLRRLAFEKYITFVEGDRDVIKSFV
ncbi:sialyltransferase [Chloropicon primus]|uniref:Sialyltransferase n=1 Tax=Chloropicon primus TaxID=1764295 RepID=A0A5B8MLY5_9CHLO|nr:sialyltransferase [Chloropicon primus]UPQ99581.1 sialyltransferase [Chloropicon primus]|eukprot:QDZ20372.1 sialyltransferase [Chloropicon primus]